MPTRITPVCLIRPSTPVRGVEDDDAPDDGALDDDGGFAPGDGVDDEEDVPGDFLNNWSR